MENDQSKVGIPIRFVKEDDGTIVVFGHIKGREFSQKAANEIALGIIVAYIIRKNSE